MKQRLVIALLAALCFGAGFVARMWTDDEPAVPPPPVALGGEFSRSTAPAATGDAKKARPPGSRSGHDQTLNRTKLRAEIDRYSAQIDAYRKRLEEIDSEFERDLVPLLNAEQRERFAAQQKKYAERRAKGIAAVAADTAPLSDDQIFRLQQRPLLTMLGEVSTSMRFDSLSKDLKLADDQKPRVMELLRVRREKFIALVDSTPPPSIMLSRLAPVAEKIAADPKK